jgi:hypothetical protein
MADNPQTLPFQPDDLQLASYILDPQLVLAEVLLTLKEDGTMLPVVGRPCPTHSQKSSKVSAWPRKAGKHCAELSFGSYSKRAHPESTPKPGSSFFTGGWQIVTPNCFHGGKTILMST